MTASSGIVFAALVSLAAAGLVFVVLGNGFFAGGSAGLAVQEGALPGFGAVGEKPVSAWGAESPEAQAISGSASVQARAGRVAVNAETFGEKSGGAQVKNAGGQNRIRYGGGVGTIAGNNPGGGTGSAGSGSAPGSAAQGPPTGNNEEDLASVDNAKSASSLSVPNPIPSLKGFLPEGVEVKLEKGVLQGFHAEIVGGSGAALPVEWSVDGAMAAAGNSFALDSGAYPEGWHSVKATGGDGRVIVSKVWKVLIEGGEKADADPVGKVHPMLLVAPQARGRLSKQGVGAEDTVQALVTAGSPSGLGQARRAIEENGGTVEDVFEVGGVIVARVKKSRLIEVAKEDSVASIWPNLGVTAALEESVPQTGATEAWAGGYEGRGVRVAVLDTGIDREHPMLRGKVVKERNFTGSETVSDVHGHGTHVAGIISGSRADSGIMSVGFNGVAPQALLYNVKVLGDNADGFYTDFIAGINWAIDPDANPATDDGAQVINMSLGSFHAYDAADPLVTTLRNVVEKGVIVVASSGNCNPAAPSEKCGDYRGVTIPASSPHVIAVGALDDENNPADFSSGGYIEGVGIKPDVSAPGVAIESASPGRKYVRMSGTSMAAPHVSGAAALLLGANPSLTPARISRLLELTATDLGETGKDERFGSGLLNLRGIMEPRPVLSTESVSYSIIESEAYSGVVTLTNKGAKALEVTGLRSTPGIEASLGRTTLEAAESTELTFSVKATDVGIGVFEGTIDLSTNAGNLSVKVKLQVGSTTRPVIRAISIPKVVWRGEVSDIVVEATDDSAVSSVDVRLTGPDGVETTIPLVLSADGKWRYINYPFPAKLSDKGSYRARVTATDDSANTTAYETSFDLVNAQFSLPVEYVVGVPATISANYKNTSFQSRDATFVAEIYEEAGDKVGELLGTKGVQSGELHTFSLGWVPQRTGNYSLRLKLLEGGGTIEELEKGIRVLVPDVATLAGLSISRQRIEKGSEQAYEVEAENHSAGELNTMVEVDVMRGGIVVDVLLLENAMLPANSTQTFALRKSVLLPAGAYDAVARLHFGNRVKESSMAPFEVFTPASGTLESIQLPERVYTETEGKAKVVFRNNGRFPLNAALYGRIMDGNTVVKSLGFGSAQVQQESPYTFEADANFSGLSGNYVLEITADYEGNTAEAKKEFLVEDDRAPLISLVSHDAEVKRNAAFTLRLSAEDSSRIGKATLSVDGEKTQMKEVSSNRNTHFLAGAHYGLSSAGEHSFSAEVCDEHSNCSATRPMFFSAVECTGTKVLVVSEEDTFNNILGSGYCPAQWKQSISGLPSLERLKAFDMVIWSMGLSARGISDDEAALLLGFVSRGGKLLIEGANIASARREDAFMVGVAHATLARGTLVTAHGPAGASEGPFPQERILARGMHPATKGHQFLDINIEVSPYFDSLVPANGGHSIADWNSGNSAMVVFDDHNTTGARGIFLPFAFRAVEEGKQKGILDNIISWLVSSPQGDFSVTGIDLPAYPIAGENLPVIAAVSGADGAVGAKVVLYVDGEPVSEKPADSGNIMFEVRFREGTHFIRAEIRPLADVFEADYFNNTLEKSVSVAPSNPVIVPLGFTHSPQHPNIGQQIEIYAEIANTGGKTADANITFFMDGNVHETIGITVPFGERKTVSTQWVSSPGTHALRIVSRLAGDDVEAQENSIEGEIYACRGAKVLIVADDDSLLSNGSPDSIPAFESALKANGYCVSTWKESGNGQPAIQLLDSFDAVVWSAGNHWNRAVDEKDINVLSQFSGNVLFEGSDIAFDSNDSGFLESNLRASFDRDIILGPENSTLLLSDSGLLKGIGSIYLNAELSPTPDSLIPFEGASIADWNNAGSAIVVSEAGNRKRAFIGFAITAITDGVVRDTLVSNFMEWLTFRNHAPEIVSVTSNSPVSEGEKLTIGINATDPEGDDLVYSISSPLFTASGSSFAWGTDFSSAGRHTFTVTVSDGNLSTSIDVNIEVINVNRAPAITSITSNSPVREGENLLITVDAADPDGETLTYSINAPQFTASGNSFAWPTGFDSAGEYNLSITVTDGTLESSMDLNIAVLNVNRPPQINSIAVNSPVKEGEKLVIDVNAFDPEGDALIYSVNSPQFIANGRSFSWLTDYNSAGNYTFTITITDGILTATQDINTEVTNTNRVPTIHWVTSNTPVREGETLIIDINATDPDNDQLAYTINSTNFTLNGSRFSWQAGHDSIGGHSFTVTVSDGSLSASQDINIEVRKLERPPVIEPIGLQGALTGEEYLLQVKATDPDNDTLRYLDNTDLFDIDASTGLVKFTPGRAQAGLYNITITVSDGAMESSSEFMLNIVHLNSPPGLGIPYYRDVYIVGDEVVIPVLGRDKDGDPLVYSIDSPRFTFDGAHFRWKTGSDSAGTYSFTITVSDGQATASSHAIISVLMVEPGGQCTDPDNGLNYLKKSTADDRVNGIGSWWEDTCLLRVPCEPGDPGFGPLGSCLKYTRVDECSGPLCNLQEGYCTGGKSSNIAFSCEYGCRKGACLPGNDMLNSNAGTWAG